MFRVQVPWTPLPLQKFSNTPEVGLPQCQQRLHQPRRQLDGATCSATSLRYSQRRQPERHDDGATFSAASSAVLPAVPPACATYSAARL